MIRIRKSVKPKKKIIPKKLNSKKLNSKKLRMGLFQSKLYRQFVKEQEEIYREKFKIQLNDLRKLPENIKKSIFLYTDSSYEFMNPKGEYITHRNNLLEAFDRISPLEKNIVLFRGLEHVDELDMITKDLILQQLQERLRMTNFQETVVVC